MTRNEFQEMVAAVLVNPENGKITARAGLMAAMLCLDGERRVDEIVGKAVQLGAEKATAQALHNLRSTEKTDDGNIPADLQQVADDLVSAGYAEQVHPLQFCEVIVGGPRQKKRVTAKMDIASVMADFKRRLDAKLS